MKEICRLDDTELASRGWRAFQLTNGRPAIIIKSGDELRAFVNRCPHAAGEVYPATNEAGAERLKCNQHGSLFTVEGMGLTGPATGMSLRALQLTLQDGVIYYQ